MNALETRAVAIDLTRRSALRSTASSGRRSPAMLAIVAVLVCGGISALVAQQAPSPTPMQPLPSPNAPSAKPQMQEQRHVRHILMRTEAEVDALLAKHKSGADFSALARVHSLDVTTKPLGGDLGFIAPRMMELEFDKVAFALQKVGDVGKCETKYGWHAMQLIATQLVPIATPPPPKPPVEQKPRPEPVKPNTDLTVTFKPLKPDYGIGEPCIVRVEITNTTDRELPIFDPALWPLGSTVRFERGRLNLSLAWPVGRAAPTQLIQRIAPRATMAQEFVLQDFLEGGTIEEWPLIRMNWRANVFFGRAEKTFPDLKSAPEYAEMRNNWKYYASDESRMNVLRAYQPGDRWFVLLHTRENIWIELVDPGIPGLLEHWIGLTRRLVYEDQPYNANRPGAFLRAGGVVRDAMSAPVAAFRFSNEFNPTLEPFQLALEVGKVGSQYSIGTGFYLTLEDPASLEGEAVVIGKVVAGKDVLTRISSEYVVRGKEPTTRLVVPYPADLVPEDVRNGTIAESSEKPTTTKPDATKPPPSNSQRPSAVPLPRVEVKTDKGVFVIELFEDDALNTVSNFIQLAESGFYNMKKIHRDWMQGENRGIIQCGSSDGTPAGNAGYWIPDEPNAREHVRGSVGLARGPQPNTGSSQFYICRDAQPYYDGQYTVFGQVVSGIEVVDKLAKGDPIMEVKVLSKRDHAYESKKLPIDPSGDSKQGKKEPQKQ
ncbi:MAG: peptidylprolyl isomerase [Planctomycetota bacterium]